MSTQLTRQGQCPAMSLPAYVLTAPADLYTNLRGEKSWHNEAVPVT